MIMLIAEKLGYNPQNYGYTYLEFEEGKKIDINDIKCIVFKIINYFLIEIL